MKKLFPSMLALMLAFSCFAGCGNPETPDTGSTPDSTPVEPVEPTHQHDKDLKDAKDYLSNKLSTKNLQTNRTFTLPSTFSFTGETAKYDVAWTVDKTDIVTITAGETEDSFAIAEISEDTPFVLTATITDPDGCHTTTFTLDGVALKAVVPVAIEQKPAEGVAYKLHVYQTKKEADCYFTGAMSGFYFATSESYEDGVDLYVEHIADSDAFNVYFMDGNTKNYIGVQEGWNSKNSYWTFNVVFDTTAPSSFVWSDEYDTIITTVPCRSTADNKNDKAEQTTTATLYLGNYDTFMTFSASKVEKAATSNVGTLVTMVDKSTIVIPDTQKVADVKASLNVQADHKMNKELTLTTTDSRYDDVTVTWAVEADKGAVLTGNKLALTIPATATTVKLTATIACGETTDTKEFTLNLGPAIVLSATPTQAEIVTAAYQLAKGEELGEFTLEGVISKVKTTYDATYKNVTVVITVEGKEIECFRMKGEGADVIKAGDTINVTGKLKNYNGTVEFDSGCKLNSYVAGTETPPAGGETGGTETPPADDVVDAEAEAIVNAAYALTSGSSLDGTQTLTGVIKSIDEAYSSQYSNVTVTIVIGDMTDKPLKCYRMKGTGADSLLVGDKITVTGTITNYNGTIEFATGCTFVMVTKHTCSTYTEVTCKTPATCTVCGTAKDNVLSPNHSYNAEHICTVCNAVEPGYEGSVAEPTTVSVTIANMGWTNSTQYKTLTMDEVITVTANGGSNTGKYYTSGNQWRIYYSENPTVVVSAKSGYTIKTVKITYVIEKGGVLTYGEAQIASNTVVDVNAASITFGVDDTVLTDGDNGENKSGQVRITAIEVVYVENN